MKKSFIYAIIAILAFSIVLSFTVSAETKKADTVSLERTSVVLKDDWRVYVDSNDIGEGAKWYTGFMGEGHTVSLPYETTFDAYTSVIWFANTFTPDITFTTNDRVYIHFEGCQYQTKVWLNGYYIGEHEGSYGKFSLDITDYIAPGQENLLALRLCSPKSGYTLRGLSSENLPLWLAGFQHIQTPPVISVEPQLRVTDIYADTKYDDEKIDVTLYVNNPSTGKAKAELYGSVSHSDAGGIISQYSREVEILPGDTEVKFTLDVKNFRPWSPDDPYLYKLNISLTDTRNGMSNNSSLSVGFKDLRIDDEGYFVLNGERIFVKCCHTSAYIEGSVDVGTDIQRQLHQLDYLKAAGFNMVRYLDGLALPELMDYADRIGLLMYEENAMCWSATDCSDTEKLLHREVSQLILRDRNHASFAVVGLLNETNVSSTTEKRYAAAVDSLNTIRDFDNDVLCLLSSGRWDARKEYASACNPGSRAWEAWMGNEGITDAEKTEYDSVFSGMGDIHYYPYMPYDAEIRSKYGIVGGQRAAFISEAGAGSQSNIIADYKTFQQEKNLSLGSSMNSSIKIQIQQLRDFYNQYNIWSMYCADEDILSESQALQSVQRSRLVDYIRSNPKINGYSMTQGSDVGYRGEGILEAAMGHKEGMFGAISDAWNDIRWCLNIDNATVYSDQTLDVDIILSQIGCLEDRDYSGLIRITGDNGTVYKKEFTIHPDSSFTVPVLKESIDVSEFGPGEYTISAVLYDIDVPCGEKEFWVFDKALMPRVEKTVYQIGLTDESINVLKSYGADVRDIDFENLPENAVFVIGKILGKTEVEALSENAEQTGSHIVGLRAGCFGDYGKTFLPLEKPGMLSNFPNWLYHNDSIIFENQLTEGLKTECLLDPVYYENVYNAKYYYDMQTPDDLGCVCFFVGNDGGSTAQSMGSGISLGTFFKGEGLITVNCLDIIEGAGDPVADRLLLNMINYEKPVAVPAEESDAE